MKRLMRWFTVLSLIIFSCGLFGWVQPALTAPIQVGEWLSATTELPIDEASCPTFDQKIDLNNANIVAFKDCQGFYPNLASLIIQHGPYQSVEDILEIPGLSDRQKSLLQAHLKNFMVSDAVVPLEKRMPPRPVMR